MKKYFAFDLETAGVDVNRDEPVEIAFAIVPEEGPYRVTSFVVSSAVPCSPEAQKVHGINQEEVNGGFSCLLVCNILIDVIMKNKIDAVVGFNCFRFDIPMLKNFTSKHIGVDVDVLEDFFTMPVEDPALWHLAKTVYNKPWPITHVEMKEIADRKVPYGTRYNLKVLCDIYGIKNREAHRAEGDLRATIDLWRAMKSIRRFNETDRASREIDAIGTPSGS